MFAKNHRIIWIKMGYKPGFAQKKTQVFQSIHQTKDGNYHKARYLCDMVLLDGKIVSAQVIEHLRQAVETITSNGQRPPHLAAVLIGTNGASETYVASKAKHCALAGYSSSLHRLPENCSEETLTELIKQLNEDDQVDGILVQLPLPAHLNEQRIINLIHPNKDVDGFSPVNTGRMVLGMPCYLPATPYGIMLLLEHYNIPTSGKHAVVIGRSNIVGRPISILLSQSGPQGNCTVTVCHSRSENIESICQSADILVVALGIPSFLKAHMVKPGAVVIDVGITRVPDASKKSGFRIQGDVDFDAVAPITDFITPVPGGVGMMTIAALMKNTLQAYQHHVT
jgi:methylenetetrahydrofolate dehydrogenase (NADP+)/methenyltetrahydrofolate cyclohydrolase